jgi:hypothetical protein
MTRKSGRKGRGHRSQKVHKHTYRVAIDGFPVKDVEAFGKGHAEFLVRELYGTESRAFNVARIS